METTDVDVEEDGSLVLMDFFDVDRNGKIDKEEILKVVTDLAASDPAACEELGDMGGLMDELVRHFGVKAKGLKFTDLFAWVKGDAGPPALARCREICLEKALEVRRAQRHRAREQREAQAVEAARRREREEAERRCAAERAAGKRLSREDFVARQVEVGLAKEIAVGLYMEADDDGDGDVDKEELGRLSQSWFSTTHEVKQAFQRGINEGGGGNIVVKQCSDTGLQAIVDTFSKWDVDGDGTITTEELTHILKKLNHRFTDVTSARLMEEIDNSGDGRIDIHEFVDWLSGEGSKKKAMKKKAKEEQDALVFMALHRRRAGEARKMGVQLQFEESRHKFVNDWCEANKQEAACGTLNGGAGAQAICSGCGGRHGWVCHGCGFVSFFDECVNKCSPGSYGWTCLYGRCKPKGCGCRKKPDVYKRTGSVGTLDSLSPAVTSLVAGMEVPSDGSEAHPEAAAAAPVTVEP